MRYIKFPIIFIFSTFFIAENIHANEYIAFSLKVAQQMNLSTPQGKDYRKQHPEVFTLGGITAMKGLVYDRETGDVILVGQRDPERAILTLDDFVVALRARFIHGKWPLVSIDPPSDTEKSDMQPVRFEGGIEDTQFGNDLFIADYDLKQIGFGLLSPGIPEFRTYWDLSGERAKEKQKGSYNIISRCWISPSLPCVPVKDDVVTTKGLTVGVFPQVLYAEIDGKKIEDFQDTAGDIFAKEMSKKFDRLSKIHSSFSRVKGLFELVALAKGLEEMDRMSDCSFWLKDYHIKKVETKKEIKVLKRKEDSELSTTGKVYRGYRKLSGGVHLVAIAMQLKGGSTLALKEAVLKTRPKPTSLVWSFLADEWLIPTSPEMLKVENSIPIFNHAVFLQEMKRYDEAISLYNKVIMQDCESSLKSYAYCGRGASYYQVAKYDKAVEDFNNAIKLNPEYTDALFGLAMSMLMRKKVDESLRLFDHLLGHQSYYAKAWMGKGCVYLHLGGYTKALECFEKALTSMPSLLEVKYVKAQTLFLLGESSGRKDQIQDSLNILNETIQTNPGRIEPLLMKAYILLTQNENPKELLESSDCALSLTSGKEEFLGFLWLCKAQAEWELGRYEQAKQSNIKGMELMKESQPWLEQSLRSFVPNL